MTLNRTHSKLYDLWASANVYDDGWEPVIPDVQIDEEEPLVFPEGVLLPSTVSNMLRKPEPDTLSTLIESKFIPGSMRIPDNRDFAYRNYRKPEAFVVHTVTPDFGKLVSSFQAVGQAIHMAFQSITPDLLKLASAFGQAIHTLSQQEEMNRQALIAQIVRNSARSQDEAAVEIDRLHSNTGTSYTKLYELVNILSMGLTPDPIFDFVAQLEPYKTKKLKKPSNRAGRSSRKHR